MDQGHPGNPWALLGLAFLFTHELDAIRCEEWRMLPMLHLFELNLGYAVFTALHVPLFFAVIQGVCSKATSDRVIHKLNFFNILHLGLHLLALWCPRNTFTSVLSWVLIAGGGFCGTVHVLARHMADRGSDKDR